MKQALISVSNKEGLIPFANFLQELEYEIISTGGTYNYLLENNINAKEISDITGFKEILDGRVKTLHPLIHSGILYKRDDKNHLQTIEEMNFNPIDLVIVNLYPFFEKVNLNISFEEKIEYIDIGGPSLLRGAAKNFKFTVPIIDPADYDDIINELKDTGDISYEKRKYLAGKTFSYTSIYDNAISEFLLENDFPEFFSGSYKKELDLRYGENPHQKATFYTSLNKNGALKDFNKLQGKDLSYNNIRDIDISWKIVNEFSECAVCAVKHNIPCGAAIGSTPFEAYKKAYECDSTSIFGGIVAFNKEVDIKTAEELNKTFLEVVIAPNFSTEALSILSSKKNLRLIKMKTKPLNDIEITSVSGGILVQNPDSKILNKMDIVTKYSPNKNDLDDMVFGMKIVKYVKSNAILVVKNGQTLGISGGEVSRIGAAENALNMAGNNGGVLISDAFFPFDDVIILAKKYNITSIVQPGGSIHDKASIDKCNELKIPMAFTGVRHFKH